MVVGKMSLGLKSSERESESEQRGENMTSCPAGSVSSSLDSLEKLFSLQLEKKKKKPETFFSAPLLV